MSDEEAKEEMDELSKRASIYGWSISMSERYKELMKLIGEDPYDFHCDHY